MHTVIMTTPRQGIPHFDHVAKHNAPVSVCYSPDGQGDAERLYAWRNCDRAIRDWWREHRHLVEGDHVAFIEWDVVANMDLSRAIVPGAGIVAPVVEVARGSTWCWFAEVDHLPAWLRGYAASVRPLAVLIISRECLDAIAAPKWDGLFARDIFCELRLATVARASGFELATHSSLANCRHFPITHPGNTPGVFHAIKLAKPPTHG
jgi:hypothetical protein